MESWLYCETTGEVPELADHTAVLREDCMIVFGGETKDGQDTNQIYEFNFATHFWRPINATGALPSPRSRHTAVIWNDKMYIFGGWTGKRNNDLYEFNFQGWKWNEIKGYGELPSKRSDHSAVVYADNMYVFGGYDQDNKFCNDLYEFSFTGKRKWKQTICAGDVPSKRWGHSAVVKQHYMYVFGGYDDNLHNNELYQFDFTNNLWTKIETIGDPPSKRYKCTAVVKENSLFIFGGDDSDRCDDIYEYSFITNVWAPVRTTGENPPKRCSHSAVVRENCMYVFGGLDGTRYYRDLHSFSITVPSMSYISKLLERQMLSDVIFLVGSQEFKAHQVIISQSKVLMKQVIKAVIAQKISSKLTNMKSPLRIPLDDIHPAVFENILKFLYNAKVNISDTEMFVALVEAAHRYDIDGLEPYCLREFDRILRLDNVLHVLQRAHQSNLEDLKNMCFGFFKQHNEKIMKQEDIQMLDRDLLFELLQILSGRKSIPPRKKLAVNAERNLYRHIMHLRQTKKVQFTDVTLVSSDDRRFEVHRPILGAFSDFFRQRFQLAIQVSNYEMRLKEIDGKTLGLIIDFIYFRQVQLPRTISELKLLVRFSDLFGIKELQDQASRKLVSILTREEALDIVQYCIKYNIKGNLKETCWKIIKSASKDELMAMIFEKQMRQDQMHAELKATIAQLQQKIREHEEKIAQLMGNVAVERRKGSLFEDDKKIEDKKEMTKEEMKLQIENMLKANKHVN